MEARIRKEDLIAFKEQSADIVIKNDIQPVLQFLRVKVEGDFATITKNNNRAFIVKSIANDSDDCEFLIDEKTLYDFMNACEGEYITFKTSGLRIEISCGKARLFSPTEPPHLYPNIDTSNENWVQIPKLTSVSAGICAKLCLDPTVIFGATSHVFAAPDWVGGSDGSIAYFQTLSAASPKLILRREVAQSLSKMSTPQYAQTESYDLFKDGETLFGFVKSEVGFFDGYAGLFRGALEVPISFSLNKGAMIKFTQLCTQRAPDATAGATFECSGDTLSMKLVDSGASLDIHMEFPVVSTEKCEFKFNPEKMTQLLKSLPCDDVYFYPGKQRYFITDKDKTFCSVIMGMI